MFKTSQNNIAQSYLLFNFTALWNSNIGGKLHICIQLRWKFYTEVTTMWLFTKAKFILRKENIKNPL